MEASIQVTGVKELLGRMRALPSVIEAGNRKAMTKTVTYTQGEAKRIVHRRTGLLSRGIRTTVRGTWSGMVGRVAPTAVYADFVERGTGLYGPRGKIIEARGGHVFAWFAPGFANKSGSLSRTKARGHSRAETMVFRRSIKGMRGQHYMQKAGEAGRREAPRFFKEAAEGIAKNIHG